VDTGVPDIVPEGALRRAAGRRAGQLTNAGKWRTSTGGFNRCAPERGQPREGTHDAIQGLSFRNSDAGSGVLAEEEAA
jgi:hypothetical protein